MKEPFRVDSGDVPVTSGIWMFNTAIQIGACNVLVLYARFPFAVSTPCRDTEGTNRGRDSVTGLLAALAAHVSSLLVLNVQIDVDNDALRLCAVTSQFARGAADDKSKPRQLLWLLRDVPRGFEQKLAESKTHPDVHVKNRLKIANDGLDEERRTIEATFACAGAMIRAPDDDDQDRLLRNTDPIVGKPFALGLAAAIARCKELVPRGPSYASGSVLADAMRAQLGKLTVAGGACCASLSDVMHERSATIARDNALKAFHVAWQPALLAQQHSGALGAATEAIRKTVRTGFEAEVHKFAITESAARGKWTSVEQEITRQMNLVAEQVGVLWYSLRSTPHCYVDCQTRATRGAGSAGRGGATTEGGA